MHSLRRIGVAAVAVLSITVLAACSSSGPGSSSGGGAAPAPVSTNGGKVGSGNGPLIAFSQEGLENSWRTENTNSILTSLQKAGYRVVWQQAGGDQSRQVAQVQNLLQQKPKLLVVEPAEQEAATPIAKLAENAGVPLIVADRALGIEPGSGQYKTLITQNWKSVGTSLGKVAVQALKKKNGSAKGNIVELQGVLGSAPQVSMDEGFKEVISAYPDIKIVASQDGNNERGPGLQITEDFLTRYPKGKIDLVWAQNDEMGIGALKAITNAGRTELVGSIISKDGQADGIAAVAKGDFAADCTNTPYFGPIITPYVKKILAGETVPAAPDKPFTCYESITAKGKAAAQKATDQIAKDKATFASR